MVLNNRQLLLSIAAVLLVGLVTVSQSPLWIGVTIAGLVVAVLGLIWTSSTVVRGVGRRLRGRFMRTWKGIGRWFAGWRWKAWVANPRRHAEALLGVRLYLRTPRRRRPIGNVRVIVSCAQWSSTITIEKPSFVMDGGRDTWIVGYPDDFGDDPANRMEPGRYLVTWRDDTRILALSRFIVDEDHWPVLKWRVRFGQWKRSVREEARKHEQRR